MTPPETIEEWNMVLAQCCCEMPVCPEPSAEYQSKQASVGCGYDLSFADGHGDVSLSCDDYSVIYRHVVRTETREIDYVDPGEPDTTDVYTRTWDKQVEGSGDSWTCDEDYTVDGSPVGLAGDLQSATWDSGTGTLTTVYVYSGDPAYTATYTRVTVFSDQWDEADWFDKAEEILTAKSWFSEGAMTGITTLFQRSEYTTSVGECEFPSGLLWTRGRYRWIVPDGDWFEIGDTGGSYFKIEWDEMFVPAGGGDSVFTPKSWEWTGPGDPEDPDSWKSTWFDVDEPVEGEFGEVTIVNVRYICYHGANYGVLPQPHPDFDTVAVPP